MVVCFTTSLLIVLMTSIVARATHRQAKVASMCLGVCMPMPVYLHARARVPACPCLCLPACPCPCACMPMHACSCMPVHLPALGPACWCPCMPAAWPVCLCLHNPSPQPVPRACDPRVMSFACSPVRCLCLTAALVLSVWQGVREFECWLQVNGTARSCECLEAILVMPHSVLSARCCAAPR